MRDPFLSICMPTHNFGKFIGTTLESLTKQLTDDVEIVIVDGASTDNTTEVVRGFQERFPGIHYYRLEKRGGIDRDLAKTVELARGTYCWLFSSDDVMKDGALRSVLREMSSGCDVYLCGLTLCTLDMKPIREHRVLNITSDAEFDLGNTQDRLRYCKFAETTTAFFSFMSSLIVKKSRWDAIPFDETFDGSLWAHVARFFRMIPAGLQLRYLSRPYLYKRGDNDSFIDKGLAHRCMFAVDGYDRLARTFFGENSVEAYHINRVVRNEFHPWSLLRTKLKLRKERNLQELALLDKVAATVYRDASFVTRTSLFVYRHAPLPMFKIALRSYKAIESYIYPKRSPFELDMTRSNVSHPMSPTSVDIMPKVLSSSPEERAAAGLRSHPLEEQRWRRSRILGIEVDVLRWTELLSRVAHFAEGGVPRLVCYVNAECLNRASFDQAYRAILHRADIVYADGMSVVWAARLTSQPLPERITLGDVLPQLCAMCVRQGYRLYILAGEPGVAEQAIDGLRRQFPPLQIAGTHHGYLTPETAEEVVEDIQRCRPDILLVGMGVPKQEKWIWQYRERLGVPVVWGVGALFDYYAGKTPRAPVWMRMAGLEWIFRLLVEPRRLWKRYLLGNAYFILRAMALPLVDAALVSLAWLGVYAARVYLNDILGVHINPVDPYLQSLPVIVGVWLAAAALLGSYRRMSAMRLAEELEQVGRAVILGLLITMAVAFLLKEADLGRSVILPFGCGMAVLLTTSRLVVRACERHLARHRIGLRRTLIIGTGPAARRVREEIESLSIGYEVTGFLSDDGGAEVVPAEEVRGTIADLGDIVKQDGIHDVFVFSQSLTLNETLNLLAREELQPVTVHVVAEELEPFSRRVRLARVAQLPVLELPPPPAGQWYAACKRVCDVVAAGAGVVLVSPLLALIGGLIRWESPGPALFAQQRIGKNGRPFSMYKFRTMRVGTPAYAVAPNDLEDPRVTRLGRLLRRWSLDELPQLLNVLRGEMSLVGPRPEMPFLVRQYEPWQRQRLSVAPGLTCLWQVIGRKELPLHTNLEYDLYYVRHRSWRLDCSILLRTIPAVMSRRGAF